AQLVGPDRTNPATDPARAIRAHVAETSQLPAVLDRACGECHSNDTVWPSYAQVAPLSWVLAAAVAEGRNAVNYSEWGAYSPSQQRTLLAASCDDASSGKMPGGAWTLLHPEARLSNQDVQTICAAARQIETNTARQR
ncbi:MAG TPA: heme-binding domain-containing protein, partial [Vicinamibacterales bacterium]|nr:heme-binding domain-containing protein [Vicinamibacterales bacterium]